MSSFSAATQALSILFHFICVTDSKAKHFNTDISSSSVKQKGNVGDKDSAGGLVHRFYTSLYAKLGSGEYLNTTKPTLFLNLIFKVIINDFFKIILHTHFSIISVHVDKAPPS